MRIAITGGRDRVPTSTELAAFLYTFRRNGGTVLLHGNARGTDRAVADYAKKRGIEVLPFDVDTRVDGPWPAAGCRRNRRMLVDGKAEMLIAFAGNRGTADCVSNARQLELPVMRIRLTNTDDKP